MVLGYKLNYQSLNLSGTGFFEREIEIKFRVRDLDEDFQDEFRCFNPEYPVNPVKKVFLKDFEVLLPIFVPERDLSVFP